MVNINIEIPEDLHKDLKLSSLMKDMTLKDYIILTLDNTVRKDSKHKHSDR